MLLILIPLTNSSVRTRRGAVLPVDDRDVDRRELREVLGEAVGVVRLVGVVELSEHTGGELADDPLEVELAEHLEPATADLRDLLDDTEVGLRDRHDVRALDLDGHERPVRERRPVDLRGGCRRERLVVDGAEDLVGILSELGDEHLARLLPGTGRTSLWSFVSSVLQSSGNASPRLATIWPSFT